MDKEPHYPIPRMRSAVASISGLWGRTASLSFGDALRALGTELAQLVDAEIAARRPFLWLAPLSIIGVLLYFAADEEPALWAVLIVSLVMVGLVIVFRQARASMRYLLYALLAIAFGFLSATLRTEWTGAPILASDVSGRIDAIIETIDWGASGGHLLLRPLSLRGRALELPYRIRATLSGHPALAPGDHISGTIRLMPPPVPARPGGYDFARDAYFARIGGVGSLVGPVTILPLAEMGWRLNLMTMVDRLRLALTDRISKAIGGQSGAVAAALFTGKRGYISDQTNDILRAAGIYHVVSISGLHMVLAAGMVFFLVRGFLVLIPSVALRFPIKRWAAGAAMIGAVAYDIFAGSEVATERSLIMTLILFGAVLVGRRAMSMRNLILSAFVIVAMEPESVLGPSFQMSFAAVAALIAAFERLPPQADRSPVIVPPRVSPVIEGPPKGLVQRAGDWLVGHGKTVFLTTLLAEAATGPFSAFHFQRFQPLGLIGNALTIPLIESLAMPIGFIGVMAIPFGLDRPFWSIMGYSVDLMLYVSSLVASTPYATRALPAISIPSVLCLSLGLLWLTLWSTRLRLVGLLPVGVGITLAFLGQRPDIVVARDGLSLAARGPDGALAVMGKGASTFVVSQWLSADGDMRQPADPSVKRGPLCNARGCIAHLVDGKVLTLTLRPRDLSEDCALATVLVTPLEAPVGCKALAIDQPRSAALGSIELFADGEGGYRIHSARRANYDRPWSLKPPERQSQSEPSLTVEPDDPTLEPITPR